jgi:hypothetical protein
MSNNQDEISLSKYVNGLSNFSCEDEKGRLHRDDGPAVLTHNGMKKWYKHGNLHRLDGPAIDYRYKKEWWIDGERIYCANNKAFLKIIDNRIELKKNLLTIFIKKNGGKIIGMMVNF